MPRGTAANLLQRGNSVTHRSIRVRATRGVAGAAALAAVLAAASPAAAQTGATAPTADTPVVTTDGDLTLKADTTPADGLDAADEQKLADRVAAGEGWTTLIMVTDKGKTSSVAASIQQAGGYVRYSSDKLNYLSAVVKTSNVEKTAKLSTVRAVDLDEVVNIPDPTVQDAGGASAAAVAPGPSTPNDNPYMPTRETGSIAFKQDNPTWDGRGVTIGILDSGVDLGHPSLNTTSTGERKIVDHFTATDPVTEGCLVTGGDATWIPMVTSVTGPTVTFNGAVYTLPAGTYRMRQVVEAQTNLAECEICGDLNRDGDTTDRIGVLWDKANKRVLVDSDDDKTFL